MKAIRRASDSLPIVPGAVREHMSKASLHVPHYQKLAEEPHVRAAAESDEAPLPTPEAREGYFGPRHYEYWLSGYATMETIVALLPSIHWPTARILDFGGASGRVIRHFAREFPAATPWLCDISVHHVEWVNCYLPGIKVFANSHLPALPFETGELDVIYAMSVFTHIDELELQWLLELRRCIRRGGALYLTIHNSETWRILPETYVYTVASKSQGFDEYLERHPELEERLVTYYNVAEAYNCNVFHPDEYIVKSWGKHFDSMSIYPKCHEYQAAVVLIK